jgi:hypothetical protein
LILCHVITPIKIEVIFDPIKLLHQLRHSILNHIILNHIILNHIILNHIILNHIILNHNYIIWHTMKNIQPIAYFV